MISINELNNLVNTHNDISKYNNSIDQGNLESNVIDNYNTQLHNEFTVTNEFIDEVNKNEYRKRFQSTKTESLREDIVGKLLQETNMNATSTNIDNSIESSSEYLSKRIGMSRNQAKNQKLMTDTVEEEKQVLEQRNKALLDGIDSKKRMIEINNYYYKKYNAQTSMLYFIVKICILLIVLSFLNERFRFIYTDMLYSISVGVISGLSFIYICYGIYDIMLRDNRNFDEYDFGTMNRSSEDYEANMESEDEEESEKCGSVAKVEIA